MEFNRKITVILSTNVDKIFFFNYQYKAFLIHNLNPQKHLQVLFRLALQSDFFKAEREFRKLDTKTLRKF